MTTYLIDHEIAFDPELGTNGGFSASNASALNMEYREVPLKNPKPHNNYIEKIHYFPQIDKIVLYEQNFPFIRIYSGAHMIFETELRCPAVILAVEFISGIGRDSICVSLSDRTFFFFEVSSNQSTPYKPGPTFHLPSTQNCLCYVPRKNILFSAGTDGTVFAWQIDKILTNDYSDVSTEKSTKNSDKERVEYRNFTTANTPWFIARFGFASCIVDLPNIEQIATGSYKNLIELWELRNEEPDVPLDFDKKDNNLGKNKKTGRAGGKTKATSGTGPFDEVAKQPTKKLEGHKKAIREIAYSENYKILVSVGFDF